MHNTPADGDVGTGAARSRPEIVKFLLKSLRPVSQRAGLVERVAIEMIARHGANAAREATVRLNRMIDRGNMPGRDLWACVVHVIHERKAS
jgi:hypothetical protein